MKAISAALFGISFGFMPLVAMGQAVSPKIEEMSGLEADMIYPPIPAPLEWRGGGCYSEPGEAVCAKGYSVLTGSEGAYTALLSGVSQGNTPEGEARWALIDMVFLSFPTSENTFWLSEECSGGPEGMVPIVFFEDLKIEGEMPKPIWAAYIHKVTAMIEREDNLARLDCNLQAS